MLNNRHSILCVDDDPATLRLLKAELEAHNYSSHHARSGEQAIQILEKQSFDLVILDLNMPGISGFETLSRIKSMADTAHMPVIFLSAHGRDELKIQGFEYGADDFIVKPFTGPMLLARIKAVLRRSAPTPPVKGIQGNMEDLSIFDLLQMLTFSEKNCTIVFPEMNGKIIIDSGNVLFIEYGAHTGMDALVRLSLLSQGTFSVLDHTITEKDDPTWTPIPLDSLVFSTAVQVDEFHDAINHATDAAQLALTGDGDNEQYSEIYQLRESFPLSPQQLCAKLPGAISANIEQLKRALEDGIIRASSDTHLLSG